MPVKNDHAGAAPEVRAIGPAFHDWLLELNAANVPEVGWMDAAGLGERLAMPHWLGAAFIDGRPVGALLGLRERAPYGSPNYRWFDQRHASFIYVDRIMIDAAARGTGAGRALYGVFIRELAAGAPWIFCEVNAVPPNPGSLAFHRRLGFEPVGRLVHVPGEKEVVMLARGLEG